LPQMVDILVDLWEAEGLDMWHIWQKVYSKDKCSLRHAFSSFVDATEAGAKREIAEAKRYIELE
jgi:hypothetical protein